MASLSLFVIFTVSLWSGNSLANTRFVLDGEEDVFQAIKDLQTEVERMKVEMSGLQTALASTTSSITGSTYIRWGRTVCPGNGSDLIYHGYMAGSKWSQTGGSSKSVCLPADPEWDGHSDGYDTGAVIYGTEIDIQAGLASALFGKDVNNEDVPCAVCKSARTAQLMIPARVNCYPGWTKEYSGYIVSGLPYFKSDVDYVCLDKSLEFSPHGGSNDDDHILHVVEAQCGTQGSLSCPPYIAGRELACVVCTK